MPERLSKKPSLWEDEIDKILQKAEPGKAQTLELRSTREWALREPAHTRYTFLTRTLFQNWLEILDKVRDLPRTEYRDDVTELRGEIDILRLTVDSVRQELESSRRRIDELSKKIDEVYSPVETDTIAKLCEAYVKIVCTIDIVHQVLLIESKNVTTVWTIIGTVPFEDSLRRPIYDAQVKILSTLKKYVPLDFYVLNVLELAANQKLEDIVPTNAKLAWKR